MMCVRTIFTEIKNVNVILKRNFQQNAEPVKEKVTEIHFKVPWGIIAGI